MKYFDWDKAKDICYQHAGNSVYAGMAEDWYWTADEIFDGEIRIAGEPWTYSYWATPVCRIYNDDDSYMTIPCFYTADDGDTYVPMPEWWVERSA